MNDSRSGWRHITQYPQILGGTTLRDTQQCHLECISETDPGAHSSNYLIHTPYIFVLLLPVSHLHSPTGESGVTIQVFHLVIGVLLGKPKLRHIICNIPQDAKRKFFKIMIQNPIPHWVLKDNANRQL